MALDVLPFAGDARDAGEAISGVFLKKDPHAPQKLLDKRFLRLIIGSNGGDRRDLRRYAVAPPQRHTFLVQYRFPRPLSIVSATEAKVLLNKKEKRSKVLIELF